MSEEERINKQIEDNIKGHEIPAPENNFTEVSEENKEAMLNAETPAREDLIRRINHTLNKIRPYLQADGGDVEFVDFQDGVVTVTMTGACAGCLMASLTVFCVVACNVCDYCKLSFCCFHNVLKDDLTVFYALVDTFS